MPCWNDLLEALRPWILPIALVGYTMLVALLLWAPKLMRPWQRYTSRTLGTLGAFALVLTAPILFIGIGLASGDTTQTRSTVSPDGSEKATLTFYGRALGLSSTSVTLTAAKCPCKHTFLYESNIDEDAFETTEIRWIDNTHLRIAYLDNGSPGTCKTKWGDIKILCTPLPASPPIPQSTTHPAAPQP